MRIGVISDTHDHCDNIEWFLKRFEEERIDHLIHLGDIIAPFAAKRFGPIARKIPFTCLYGNNDGEREGLKNVISEWATIEDGPKRLELGGKVVIINHYPMAATEVASAFPDADYYFSGHTHRAKDEREGGLRLINPGEAGGWLTGVKTAGIFEPETDTFQRIELQ